MKVMISVILEQLPRIAGVPSLSGSSFSHGVNWAYLSPPDPAKAALRAPSAAEHNVEHVLRVASWGTCSSFSHGGMWAAFPSLHYGHPMLYLVDVLAWVPLPVNDIIRLLVQARRGQLEHTLLLIRALGLQGVREWLPTWVWWLRQENHWAGQGRPGHGKIGRSWAGKRRAVQDRARQDSKFRVQNMFISWCSWI